MARPMKFKFFEWYLHGVYGMPPWWQWTYWLTQGMIKWHTQAVRLIEEGSGSGEGEL